MVFDRAGNNLNAFILFALTVVNMAFREVRGLAGTSLKAFVFLVLSVVTEHSFGFWTGRATF